MGRPKAGHNLRGQEYSLHIQIQTKKQRLKLLINQLKDIKARISTGKEGLKELIEEHKEIRALMKEQEGYQW